VKRAGAIAVCVVLSMLIVITASACSKAAGTYVETVNDAKNAQTIVTTLKIDASGKYAIDAVWTITDMPTLGDVNPMYEKVDRGTWTVDGDKLTFKGWAGAKVGTLSGDTISLCSYKFVKK
jgi:hypothetical protein